LVYGVLRFAKLIANEVQLYPCTGEVMDGGNFFEKLLQPLFLKPTKGIKLDLN
jgi:hypothetical protein